MILTEQPPLMYQIFINGVKYGVPQMNRQLAESLAKDLALDSNQLIEVRQITADGKQVLFG